MANIYEEKPPHQNGGAVLSFPARHRPSGEKSVKRLEVFALFELATAFARFRHLVTPENFPAVDYFITLGHLEGVIKKFRDEQPAFGIASDNMYETLRVINFTLVKEFYVSNDRQKMKDNCFDRPINNWEPYSVKSKLDELEHVLALACRKSETYFIERKLGFDVSLLLHNAEENIHQNVRGFISKDAIEEIRSAGRCFAVENFTAAGFHILRALEVVMGDYYKSLSGTDKEFKSWNDYVDAFKELEKERDERHSKYPSQKVSAMLDRMRQLDRNPLMHPRDTLDEMGADNLFKLGIITITELAKDMRDRAGQQELKLVTSDAQESA